jgi:hypothetical protein
MAARNIVFALFLAGLLSLRLSPQSYEQLGKEQQYFPKGAFAHGQGDGDFVVGWYSSQLRAMKEPSLSTASPSEQATTYRFTWLRTFHHPLVARFVLDGSGAGTLYVKMADGAGGYQPGKVIVDLNLPVETGRSAKNFVITQQDGFLACSDGACRWTGRV